MMMREPTTSLSEHPLRFSCVCVKRSFSPHATSSREHLPYIAGGRRHSRSCISTLILEIEDTRSCNIKISNYIFDGTMSVSVDIVVKLGGSAITEKSQQETFKDAAISDAVTLIKLCVDEGLKVIVVHGAGSFGHQQAKEYSVKQGWRKNDGVRKIKKGFSLTRVSCLKLNSKVVEKLTDVGVPAVGLSPCGKWTTRDGEVIQSGVAAVCDFLQADFVPVLHGDCVLDTVRGCTILSGDTVIKTLCKDLPVKRVVFLTDVAGIYDKPPQMPDAKLIPDIMVDKNGKITQKIATDVPSCDVTGGIELKLLSAIGIVLQSEGNIPVFVCKVGSEVAKDICMEGRRPVVCDGSTLIKLCKE